MSRELAIQAWLISVLGYDDQHVIEAKGTGARPKGDYATYFLVTSAGKDYPEASMKFDLLSDDDIKETFLGRKIVSFDVNIYAEDGQELHEQLGMSRNLEATQDILKAEQMVLIEGTPARDLSAMGDIKYRRRYQAEYRFRTEAKASQTNQKVLAYEIEGELDGDSTTITVP